MWWLLWQWKAQSPGNAGTNSSVRVVPGGTSTVVSGTRADFGTTPPSVPTTLKEVPCMWIGWLSMVTLASRTRTRSPVRAVRCGTAGNIFPLKVKRLKSSITIGSGTRVPGCTAHSPRKSA